LTVYRERPALIMQIFSQILDCNNDHFCELVKDVMGVFNRKVWSRKVKILSWASELTFDVARIR
jgi:hypothetical protein